MICMIMIMQSSDIHTYNSYSISSQTYKSQEWNIEHISKVGMILTSTMINKQKM